ncbi:YtxH domain-containing protein [Bacillus andreraoultii]|uniref:YtxH domain-containing protein n=1 Tax=Bacillus andreraoultii TaxID=1499685 RepID=UPI0005A6E9E8|nr:YtxH domain-containing protein [Bacillus andreraoultii]
MEEKRSTETKETKDFLTGVIIGGIVGSLAALLFAPKSGKDIRHDLQSKAYLALDKTDELKNIVIQKGNDVREFASDAKGRMTKAVKEQTDVLVGAVQSVTKKTGEDAIEVLEDARKTIEELSNEIDEKLDALKNN